MKLELIQGDCMDVMRGIEDNYYDLAVVDPPYGIEKDGQRGEVYSGEKSKHNKKHYEYKGWDNSPPTKEYFIELVRVSKNRIIWGANYFIENLSSSSCFLFWDKGQKLDQADGELAYCSIQKPIRSITINRCHIAESGLTIHPTQKPVKLYDWIYHNYAQPGQKILDTHLGSGSNAIAAHYAKMDLFTGIELDPDYFTAAQARIKECTRQQELFLR